MTVAYATETDLAAWLPSSVDIDAQEASRLLVRASTLMDRTVRTAFAVDTATDLPTDTDIAAALRDATCAQVEFWAETSEEHDIDGLAGQQYTTTGYSGNRAPRLAPRAVDALMTGGLLAIEGDRLPEEAL